VYKSEDAEYTAFTHPSNTTRIETMVTPLLQELPRLLPTHPTQQGLKQGEERQVKCGFHLLPTHPTQQGLKQVSEMGNDKPERLLPTHPTQQGLKPFIPISITCASTPFTHPSNTTRIETFPVRLSCPTPSLFYPPIQHNKD